MKTGPRVNIYLQEEDKLRYGKDIERAFQKSIPLKYRGINLMWRKPGVDVHNTTKELGIRKPRQSTVATKLK